MNNRSVPANKIISPSSLKGRAVVKVVHVATECPEYVDRGAPPEE